LEALFNSFINQKYDLNKDLSPKPKVMLAEDGEIWFSLPRPYPDISGSEKTFLVELHFYNKKIYYYINIQGVAELVSNTNVMPDNIIRRFIYLAHGQLLLCVKIGRMEYFEKRKNKNLHLFDPIADLLRWLIYKKERYHLWETQLNRSKNQEQGHLVSNNI
jgi:hypothetical protein